jgi:hypothetical protein
MLAYHVQAGQVAALIRMIVMLYAAPPQKHVIIAGHIPGLLKVRET